MDFGQYTLSFISVIYHQDGVEFALEGGEIPGYLKGSKKGNIFITIQKVSSKRSYIWFILHTQLSIIGDLRCNRFWLMQLFETCTYCQVSQWWLQAGSRKLAGLSIIYILVELIICLNRAWKLANLVALSY